MTKEQQFNQEERRILNKMDEANTNKNFIPIVGMQPKSLEGNGYKGIIEYVGKDYFILRSFKTDEPVLIRPFQYHNFEDYKTEQELLNPIFQDIVNSIFQQLNKNEMKFFKNKISNEYYFEGKDQKRHLNLINAKTGSEYFLPGYYLDELGHVEKDFKPVTLDEVLKAIPEPYFSIPKQQPTQ